MTVSNEKFLISRSSVEQNTKPSIIYFELHIIAELTKNVYKYEPLGNTAYI